MTKKIERRSDCPISYALDIFGDKWTLLILRDLVFFGKHTYGEFAASNEKIATNILADRLALLEAQGIVIKETDEEKKSRFIYSITKKGIDLIPTLLEIVKWSYTYDADTTVPKALANKIKTDRTVLIKQLEDGLKKNQHLFKGWEG